MASLNFAQFGNDLYTGKRSVPFVAKRKLWYTIASVLMVAAILIPFVRGGFNFSIDFTGGSQFLVTNLSNPSETKATDAMATVVPNATVYVTIVGGDSIRIQTDQLSSQESKAAQDALADTYGVADHDVSTTFIGASWGSDVTAKAVQGLIVFTLLALVLMALYFRTWKMSLAAILGLVHDLIITAGVYAATGFEISPGTMIDFLTILGYSLYDTVVVFDKIRENTAEEAELSRRTFAESVNLGVNQTLVRSINTGVVAALPVGGILFIGAFALGADTLRDISLALFVGILVGTYSTVFLAAPLYSHMREKEQGVQKHDRKVLSLRPRARVEPEQPALD